MVNATPHPRSRGVRPSGGQAAVALIGLTLFLLSYACLVLTPQGRALDTSWTESLVVSSYQEARAATAMVRLLGPPVLLPASALGIIAVAGRRPARAASLAVACGGLLASAWLLKITLPRPGETGELVLQNSYPSGHVAAAAAFAMVVVGAVSGRARLAGLVVGVVLVTTVAGGVVVLQWHRPGDAAGAAALAVTWWGVFLFLESRWPGPADLPKVARRPRA